MNKNKIALENEDVYSLIEKIYLSQQLEAKKHFLINVVVPTVNGNKSTNLLLTPKEMAQVRKADMKKGRKSFCMGMDSDICGNLLHTGYFGLDKSDFDRLLKDQYNKVKNPKLKPI